MENKKADIADIVIVGAGGYGITYVNALLDDKINSKRCRVVGVVEPYPVSCERLDELTAAGAVLYNSLEEFYGGNNTADLAVISTPIQFHARQITIALENGSNVLCEKPLSGDESDIEKLIEVRNRTGKFVSIGYQWSHSNAIQCMKADIISGIYGCPRLLKTIVLWPRNNEYFKRGTGWAGKLKDKDGTLIRDSVANNATAHYLNNIFYVLGETIDTSLMPKSVEAKLYRANRIETFDTAVMKFVFGNGCRGLYIASHATDMTRNPEFEYIFEKGKINCINSKITGIMPDGKIKIYGDPYENTNAKLWLAVDNVLNGEQKVVCGIEAASVQTRVIAEAHKNNIVSFSSEQLKINSDGVTYVSGLYDELCKYYDDTVL